MGLGCGAGGAGHDGRGHCRACVLIDPRCVHAPYTQGTTARRAGRRFKSTARGAPAVEAAGGSVGGLAADGGAAEAVGGGTATVRCERHSTCADAARAGAAAAAATARGAADGGAAEAASGGAAAVCCEWYAACANGRREGCDKYRGGHDCRSVAVASATVDGGESTSRRARAYADDNGRWCADRAAVAGGFAAARRNRAGREGAICGGGSDRLEDHAEAIEGSSPG